MRRPASLRGRVLVVVLVSLTVLLVLLFAAVNLALQARLDSELRTRLVDRASLARELDGSLSGQQLADRLVGDGIAVQLCLAGTCVDRAAVSAPAAPDRGSGGGPAGRSRRPGPPGQPTPVQVGDTLVLVTDLSDSSRLTLTADAGDVRRVISRLVGLQVLGGLAMLAVAAALLWLLVGRALRPLDIMTARARGIAAGGPSQSLAVAPPGTELGRTGAVFDDMVRVLRDAEQRARTAQAEAESAEQRMRAFLSDASHELRTPLTGLSTTAEVLLREEPDRDERERLTASLVREARRAGRLVDDLLTAARTDGSMTLESTSIDLRVIAEQEVERVRRQAPQLRVAVLDGAAAPLVGDGVRLGQVVGNLLDNAAAAAGPEGQVHVSVRETAQGVRLDVDDDGPGIPDADRERVFDRLVRLDPARTGSGSGLGLAIARQLTQACAGTLICRPSGSGSLPGAAFRLELPSRVGPGAAAGQL